MKHKSKPKVFSTSRKINWYPLLLLILTTAISCTKDRGIPAVPVEKHHYPEAIGKLITGKCATSGCHNASSREAAGGLNLETWESMFEGSRGGAVVIPFRSDFSTLVYYINTYSAFGSIQLSPRMPLNQEKLAAPDVQMIYEWINNGAPDHKGNKFAGRGPKKFYVTNQGCDVVTVFDAAGMLATRYISVGETGGIEAPHYVRVSPDNQFWYVSFIAGGYFQKFRVSDNAPAGKVNLGVGSWNTFAITGDSKTAYVIDWNSPGKIAEVDLATMTATMHFGFVYPHGSALMNDALYVTSQYGNFIYKISLNDFDNPAKVVIDNSGVPSGASSLDPHEIVFSPDGSKYYVTCQNSNEVRVLSTAGDNLLAVIPTGKFPQEMSVSKTSPYLFVTCMEEPGVNAQKGLITIINYQTNQVAGSVYPGYQPHGITVDDENKRVYIANRNILSTGPTPHHQGACAGRNGYITAIDLNTLGLLRGFSAEVSVDPYSIGISY